MQIAQIIANYSLGGADLLRRAMGKKKAEAMAKERDNFVAGAEKNGISAKKANEIFDLMEKFAEYGFNKSHSAAYALISYYTAWLKTHYKVEFMAALLTSEMGNQDKLLRYISASKDMGIEVVKPSINDSQRCFSALDGKILFGLGGIKNVGDEAIREIIKSRTEGGQYKSLLDLCSRVNSRKLTRRVLESLIRSGACDCLGATRAAMLACAEIVQARGQKDAKASSSPQASLIAMAPKSAIPALSGVGIDLAEAHLRELDDDERMKAEKEALGFFLTSHPLQPYGREIPRLGLDTLAGVAEKSSGSQARCGVLVTKVREVLTKGKGERMAFVEVEDLTGHAEVTFFPRDYAPARELLNSDQPLYLLARLESAQNDSGWDNDEESAEPAQLKLLGQGVRRLADVCGESGAPLLINIPAALLTESALLELKNILAQHKGAIPVEARIEGVDYSCKMSLPREMTVRPGPELTRKLDEWSHVA